MLRNSKRKLAIVAGISECLVYAEARYCAFEIHGEPKYYVCPRTEHCCNFGCCVSPAFQIYHLWYYWLLVIIMFLVCSGGGWWYRYWLQGRYRAAASAIPSRGTGSSRGQSSLRSGQSSLRRTSCPAQQASITYNSARNTVLLHRVWEAGPHKGVSNSPPYSGPQLAAGASSTHFQNTSVVLNDVNCPYYQLYGPPPSYETVIAQTRGKLSSPMSPERTRNVDVSPATGSSILQNQELLPRCYNHSSYNSHPSQAGAIAGLDPAVSRYDPNSTILEPIHQIDSVEASTAFGRYAPPYTSSSIANTPVHPGGRAEQCLPIDYRGAVPVPLDDAEARIVPETFRIYHSNNLERLPSYHGERASVDTRLVDGSIVSEDCRTAEQRRSSKMHPGDSHSSVPDLKLDGRMSRTPQDEPRYSRHHGGSLKFSRNRDDVHGPARSFGSFRRGETFLQTFAAPSCRVEDVDVDFGATCSTTDQSSEREFRAADDDFMNSAAGFSRSTRNGLLAGDSCRSSALRYGIQQQQQQQQQQTNPSDNVILEPLTSVKSYDPEVATASNVDDGTASWRTRRHANDEKKRRRVPSPRALGTNHDDVPDVVVNHESKHNKLDRSKSLD